MQGAWEATAEPSPAEAEQGWLPCTFLEAWPWWGPPPSSGPRSGLPSRPPPRHAPEYLEPAVAQNRNNAEQNHSRQDAPGDDHRPGCHSPPSPSTACNTRHHLQPAHHRSPSQLRTLTNHSKRENKHPRASRRQGRGRSGRGGGGGVWPAPASTSHVCRRGSQQHTPSLSGCCDVFVSLCVSAQPSTLAAWADSSCTCACVPSCFNPVQLSVTPRALARQAPLSMGFSRQEHWSGLPCPPPGHLPNPGIELALLTSPALGGRFFTTSATWEAQATSSWV